MTDIKYIAVVDDHPMFRKGLSSLINSFPNYKVLFDAANGKDFIAQLKQEHLPDIVLLDINMPEMDGYATAEWLNLNYPEVKILALSTLDADTAIIKMIKSGAKGYILKDADLSELKLAFSELTSIGFFYNDLISRKIVRSVNFLNDTQGPESSMMNISKNELQFMKLACSEKTYHEIAKEMFLSEKTIDGYRSSLFTKLKVTSRVGLVMYAIKNGIVQL